MRNVGPLSPGGDPTLAGDVTGAASGNTVAKIAGNVVGSAGALTALGGQPLDADLTALAAAGNSTALGFVGKAALALSTSGAVSWNPNTNPVGAVIQSAAVASITATVPTSDGQQCWLILVGNGDPGPVAIGNAAVAGGAFVWPGNGVVTILQFFGAVTLPGGAQWKSPGVNVS